MNVPTRTFLAFFGGLLIVGVLSSCTGSTESSGPPAHLLGVGSTSVVVQAGATAADSLGIKVVDAKGRGVSNVQVNWSADASGTVTVSPASSVTGQAGVARAIVQAGTRTGTGVVRAAVVLDGTPVSVQFDVTIKPGPAASLQLPQSVTMGTGVSRTMALTAFDQYGNPTAAIGATWNSSNTTVAEVSASGVIMSRALGAATVTARIGQASGETRVWVVPATMTACETNTATLCSNWTLNVSQYHAVWPQGSQAIITVDRFDADTVRFSREDPAGTSKGMRAVYRGAVQNRAVRNGRVTWTHNNLTFSGTWYADW